MPEGQTVSSQAHGTQPQVPNAPAPQFSQTQAPAAQPQPAPDPRDELARQLSTLSDAMRQLAESQKTLLDTVRGQAPGASAPPASPASAPSGDVGGDPGSGQRPGAVIDYSRLSPTQQIALGLKDSSRPTRTHASAGAD